MSDCLLVLYWPDFAAAPLPLRASASPGLTAALVGHCLHRQLSLRFDGCDAFAWVSGPAGEEAAAFRRWGMRLLQNDPSAEEIACLLRRRPEADRVILAMAPERAAGSIEPARALGTAVEVWAPEAPGAPDALPGARVLSLDRALHLTTANPVALYVESQHLEGAARRLQVPPDAPWLRASLLRAAEQLGAVVTASLYTPDGLIELAGRDPEPPAEARELSRALLAAADDPGSPRTWIVSAAGPWLPEVIDTAHSAGIRVLLWPEECGLLTPEARARADAVESLAHILGARGPGRVPRPHAQAPAPPAAAAVGDRVLFKPLQASVTEAVTPRESVLPPEAPQGGEGSARLGPWIRLIYRIECLLRQNHWNKIAFRKLASALADSDEFGPTPANVLMWLNRGKAEGILLVEQEPHRADPGIRVTTCRPNPEHPIARAAIEAPDRCLRLLHQMLQKMPWVSFKLLRSVLRRDQWLGRPPYRLDEAGIDEWLNFLIHDGAVTMTKEPNLVNPEYPVTALRLNEKHPLSRAVATEAVEGTRLAAERAILAVDHFLTRQRKPWMSMTALRRSLDGMVREELQEVLQALQSLGALVTESYPNPQKEHFTTGCRLKLDEPIVAEALNTRNAIIRITQHHHRYRSWVTLAKVDEDLAERPSSGSWAMHRLAWFVLLRDEGILELDHEGPIPETAWGNVRCRLNVADPVVRSVVAESAEAALEIHPAAS